MTKNHILIKSVALGALLLFSPIANAGVDQVLVTYFNVLYKSQSPKCSIDDATKSSILAQLEPKCLVRTKADNGESYISGTSSECGEIYVKAVVDSKVQSLCANTAAVKQEQQIAQQQAAAAKQQAAASGGGSSDKPSTSDMLKEGAKLYKKVDKVFDNREKYEAKAGKVWDKITGKEKDAKPATTTTASKPTDSSATATKPATTSSGSGKVEYVEPTQADRDAMNARNNTLANKIEDQETRINAMKDNRDKVCANPDEAAKCGRINENLAQREQELQGLKDQEAQQVTAQTEQQANQASAEAKQELATAPQSMQNDANANVLGEGAKAAAGKTDAVTAEADQAAEAAGKADDAKGATTLAQANADGAAAIVNCMAELKKLEAAHKSYNFKKSICVKAANTANNFCDKARSPGMKQVQQYMTIGGAVLSKVTAASEACGTTSTISKVAQAGVLAAQLTCTTVKFTCDKGCKAADEALQTLDDANKEFKTCAHGKVQTSANTKLQTGTTLEAAPPTAPQGAELVRQANTEITHAQSVAKASLDYDKIIAEERQPATVTDKIAEDGKPSGKTVTGGSAMKNATEVCGAKAKADMMLMGAAALGLLSAHLDAKKCEEQLTAGGGDGGKNTISSVAGSNMTTSEYCSQPSNASSTMCKCTANPNADGCLGSMSGTGLSLGKVNTNGTLSGFAGPGRGNGTSLTDAAKKAGATEEPAPGAGLSEAAREALGIGSAGSVGAAGGGGGGESAPEAKANAAKEEKEKSKFSFMSSLGSMFSGGSKPAQAAKAAIRGYEQDQAIKRKLASDQVRSEITKASGKSNFDKIKSRYQSNVSSFEQ